MYLEFPKLEWLYTRVVQLAASLHLGCEKIEREWENEEEMERELRNGEKMERKWGIGERMRKCREIPSLHLLISSLFPPSLSISYIKNCIILAQNGQYGTFVVNVTKKLSYVLWKIILGRLRCEKAPQVVRACFVSNIFLLNWLNLVLFFFQNWHFTHPIEFQMLWKWKQSTQRISNSWKE